MQLNDKKTLLVIDDETVFCGMVKDFLESDRLNVLSASTAAAAMEICAEQRIDVVLLDQKLPDGEGHALAPAIIERNDRAKIIFITAFPSFENAVKAVRAGAHDYLSKPLNPEELKLSVANALRTQDLEQVEQVHRYEKEKERQDAVLVGQGAGLAEVARMVASAAHTDAPVLITGETGTGKNLVAKSIHYSSGSGKAPFISINCAALPEQLIEAELFGYEKGAFTGAAAAKKGLFEMAEGGTLFLDEIGDMPLHLQSKLLSAIDDRVIRRLGSTSTKPVSVRIIAATNSEIEKVLGVSFRKDLYYRLSVVRIHIPPLRERPGDIPGLCEYLLHSLSKGREVGLAQSEVAKLQNYDWPGNVRELRNVLERSLFLQSGPEIRPSLLITAGTGGTQYAAASPGGLAPVKTLEETEKAHILSSLARFQGNLTQTAKALGISLSTLKRKIKDYHLR